ncbi:hypothetical protein ACHHYP_11187 [Achlya hypogyna]|uniref:Uncharacterized protein n=1 Tax=Achlya hypogyna TaxID=1202772 RepID=A0A1V9YJM6_ACHHY|nr:hypothetical protein ACHHYP_11187 [Achlya hypogyna]
MTAPAPWTAIPSPPARPLKDIMDETRAQELHAQEALPTQPAPLVYEPEMAPVESVSVDSDYALALALQNEEQQSAYTVDYSRLASLGSDAVVDDDADVPLRLKERSKRKDVRLAKTSLKNAPKKHVKEAPTAAEAFAAAVATQPLVLLTGTPEDLAAIHAFIAQKTPTVQVATLKSAKGHDLLVQYETGLSPEEAWTPLDTLVPSTA